MKTVAHAWDRDTRETAYEAARKTIALEGADQWVEEARTLLNATGRLTWETEESCEEELAGRDENAIVKCRMRRTGRVDGQYRRSHEAASWARSGRGSEKTHNTIQWLGPVWLATLDDRVRNTNLIVTAEDPADAVGLAEGLWREDARRSPPHDIEILSAHFASVRTPDHRGMRPRRSPKPRAGRCRRSHAVRVHMVVRK